MQQQGCICRQHADVCVSQEKQQRHQKSRMRVDGAGGVPRQEVQEVAREAIYIYRLKLALDPGGKLATFGGAEKAPLGPWTTPQDHLFAACQEVTATGKLQPPPTPHTSTEYAVRPHPAIPAVAQRGHHRHPFLRCRYSRAAMPYRARSPCSDAPRRPFSSMEAC
jgi:hypothetical protein